jgi:hypothetical protein
MLRSVASFLVCLLCAVALGGLAAFLLGTIDPALAQRVSGTRGGPAPLIGVGLPIAGAVIATVLLARRFRRRQ